MKNSLGYTRSVHYLDIYMNNDFYQNIYPVKKHVSPLTDSFLLFQQTAVWKASGKCPESLEGFKKVFRKININCGKLLKSMERLWILWMISIQSGRSSHSLEDFWSVCRIFGRYESFPYSLENIPNSSDDFQTVWDISGHSGRFQDSMEDFRMVWKISD